MRPHVFIQISLFSLQEYYEDFIADGYDDMRSIAALEEGDLAEMGFKRGHKKRFLTARDRCVHVTRG